MQPRRKLVESSTEVLGFTSKVLLAHKEVKILALNILNSTQYDMVDFGTEYSL